MQQMQPMQPMPQQMPQQPQLQQAAMMPHPNGKSSDEDGTKAEAARGSTCVCGLCCLICILIPLSGIICVSVIGVVLYAATDDVGRKGGCRVKNTREGGTDKSCCIIEEEPCLNATVDCMGDRQCNSWEGACYGESNCDL